MGLIDNAAKLGRNGDTELAHLTKGEVVIPKEIAQLRPDLIERLVSQVKSMGGDPSQLMVGAGSVNPQTGLEEFATQAEISAAYAALGRGADAAGSDYWKNYQGNDFMVDFRSAAESNGEKFNSNDYFLSLNDANSSKSFGLEQVTGSSNQPFYVASQNQDGTYGTFSGFGNRQEALQNLRSQDSGGAGFTILDATSLPNRQVTTPSSDLMRSLAAGNRAANVLQQNGSSPPTQNAVATGNGLISSTSGQVNATQNATNTQSTSTTNAAALQATPTQVAPAANTVQPLPLPSAPAPAALQNSQQANQNSNQQIATQQYRSVREELNDLISENSDYIKAARAGAQRQANSRGLINSSMAAGAGELAAIQSALPIAAQDAGNRLQISENSLDRNQRSDLLNRELDSVEGRQTQQLQTQVDLANLDVSLRNMLLDKQIGSEKDILELRSNLGQVEAAFNAKLTDEAEILRITRGRNANIDQSLLQMGQNYLSSVERIMSSDVPPAAQPALIEQLKLQYQDQIEFARSLKDLTVLASGQAGT